MTLTTGAKIGPYEIVGLLGAGGMGEVYRGRDARLGRDVAVKVLPANLAADTDRMARFQREAQVLASLNHPHIAALYGLEEFGGVRALVMELVEGPTLDERIKAGPIPLDEALPIAKQIAEALEAAHEKGIIHRDLKPANVKLTGDGAVKVLDFGLAKALDDTPAPGSDAANSPTLTMGATTAGTILGTAAYMSPEQAKGRPVDRRADIWAYGVVLMEMLTGKPLYSGETAQETLAAVLLTSPSFDKLPSATPPSIRKLLRRCLEKDPKRRLQAIGEARIAIEEAASEAPAEPRASASGLPWLIAASAVLCALAVSFVHFRETTPTERVLRYSIAVPEKSRIDTFAVSPDGHYLAIAAAGTGKRQLWVRPMETLAAQPLRGTEDATYPFWSPDSRSVGFFAEGKLKRIDVNGGPAQTLCDASVGRGGTWSRDGVIVFSVATGALQRVAAVGGVPAAVTKLEGTGSHRFPEFLPDGRLFLYYNSSGQGGVYVASLDSQSTRKVLADRSSFAWLPAPAGSRNGYLLFARETTLMAQPFDEKTLQPAGDLFPVAEQVSIGPHTPHAQASISSNGVLVYWGGGGFGENQLAWYDRTGKPLRSVGAPASIENLALSPDERTVALTRRGSSTGADIWLHELARGADTRFTYDANNHQPVWSPDGRRIAYYSLRSGLPDLYLKDASGAGKDEILLASGQPKFPTDWSADGRFLLYAEITGKTMLDLWVLPEPGSAGHGKPVPFLQTQFNETQGQFSPDGRWIAYASDESGRYEIYVRPFPPGAGKWKISISGGEFPRWRHDGKELFYLSPERKLMAAAVKAGPGAERVFEVSAPETLFDSHAASTNPGFNYFSYAVAADGKRFLVNTTVGEAAESPLTVVVNWLAAVKK
jgi:serine/threonine protein kinase/Tol biopolymer transport system component